MDFTQVVFIHKVFQYEVETAKGSDEWTRYREDDDHGKYQHHPGVMFSEPELQPDVPPDGWDLRLTSGQTDLDQIPEQLGKPRYCKG